MTIAARDKGYAPRADAVVDVRVTSPSGRVETLHADPRARAGRQFRAAVRAPEPGIYRVSVDARQGPTSLGSSTGDDARRRRRSGDDRSAPERRHAAARRARVGRGGDRRRRTARAARSAERRARRPRCSRCARISGTPGGRSRSSPALLAAEWLTRRRWGLQVRRANGAGCCRVLRMLVATVLAGAAGRCAGVGVRALRADRVAAPTAKRPTSSSTGSGASRR